MEHNSTICSSTECIINTEGFFHNNGIDYYEGYLRLCKPYEVAIREMEYRIELISKELETQNQLNPFWVVKSRLKSPESIINKLIRNGIECNPQSAKINLTDIAGVKVICRYLDEVYLMEELLRLQEDISIVRKTDYIKNPKPNGYRSVHIIAMVPVFVSGIKEKIPVEIQIRTVAMDYWASLEHQIYYKRGCDGAPEEIIKRLKDCADTIASVDIEMQNINRDLEMRCSKDVTPE